MTAMSTADSAMQKTRVGYEGNCPVCILDMKKWVKGSPEHQATYDNTVYYFPNAETKQKFLQNPTAYVPALGGDCAVCLAKMGKRVPGINKYASLHENRVYLFPEAKQKKMFDASPAEYANVDLAAEGNCVVCSAKMNKQVPGNPEFTVIHKGMRYQFPEDKQRQMFIQSPNQFISANSNMTGAAAAPALGMGGYCPVCVVMMNKWVKGSPDHATVFDGKKYMFPDAGAMEKFVASPEKFVPALNGDCTLCYAKMGKRVAGSIEFASMHNGRVFLFPSKKEKEMFDASPTEFANVDLAANGNCVVCSVKMNKQVPGKPEFTAIHNGLRYQFPGEEQRQMFIQSPGEFVTPTTK